MKKTLKKAVKPLCLVLAAIFAVSLFVSPKAVRPAYASNASVQKYNEQIAALEAQQKELKAKINAIEGEQSEAADKKAYLDTLVATVGQKIQAAESLVAELDAQIEDANAAIEKYEKSIASTTETIKERMLVNQQTGKGSYIDVLTGAEGVGDFLSRVERLSNMLEYDKEKLAEYKEQKAALEDKVAELEDSKKLQEETLETLEADKAESEAASKEAEAYYTSLQSDKSAYEAEYKKAVAAEQALDNELNALLQSIKTQNSSQVTANGEFMWPLPTGTGYISCYFGGSDPNGRAHYAVDCACAGGTPIYASNDATVVRAEYHYSYGNYVLLDHGNGKATLYAHCSSLACSAGQSVAKGQVIAYVGTTGFSTGCHLHFEFRVNGNKVNPLSYMTCGC